MAASPAEMLLLGGHRGGVGLDGGHDGVGGLLDAAADAERVGAGGHVLQALGDDDVGEKCGGSGAVAGHVVGLHGHLAHQLGAHVLDRVLQLDFLSDGHAIVGDERSAVGLLQGHVAALGAERHLDGIGQLGDARGQAGAGIGIELDFLSHKFAFLSVDLSSRFIFSVIQLRRKCRRRAG